MIEIYWMNEKTGEMMNIRQESKLILIYKDTKEKAARHLALLRKAGQNEIIESDRIIQYIQETIDCLKICMNALKDDSELKQQYARYKDELGEMGEEIIKLTKPNRW